MNINEIFQLENAADIITNLKEKSVDIPQWYDLLKDYEPRLHDIMTNKVTRKSKGDGEEPARIPEVSCLAVVGNPNENSPRLILTLPLSEYYCFECCHAKTMLKLFASTCTLFVPLVKTQSNTFYCTYPLAKSSNSFLRESAVCLYVTVR